MSEPTEELRREVKTMAAVGLSAADIAALLKLDPEAVARDFAAEMESGPREANAKVEETLRDMAAKGNKSARRFLKTHGPPEK